jgi:hypothetical protein
METKRLQQVLQNLKILEKNCTESKKGFEPSTVVCMYLTECILPVVDIYPTNILRKLTLSTAFNNRDELISFLDITIGRMKRAEYYALSKEEINGLEKEVTLTAYDFIIDPNFEPRGQLEKFLRDLLERLTVIHDILTDPRRNQAKISYLERTFVVPITHIASVLEAISVGIANV